MSLGVANSREFIDQAIYVHRPRGKQQVKVTCDLLKLSQIRLRRELHGGKHFIRSDASVCL
ncbi:hypothetical protein [Acidovorax temperans]|uniref:hypothetical protein n=1 Tax=Acidovorax temperans TaxID=80878 RepID=UPI0012ED9159|nr:hypothetical protein [Acidovorax temperans]